MSLKNKIHHWFRVLGKFFGPMVLGLTGLIFIRPLDFGFRTGLILAH
jgi:hypothetical protein